MRCLFVKLRREGNTKKVLRQDNILEKKRKKCIYIQETNKPGRNFSYQLRHLKIQKNEVLDSKAQETKNEKVKKHK